MANEIILLSDMIRLLHGAMKDYQEGRLTEQDAIDRCSIVLWNSGWVKKS